VKKWFTTDLRWYLLRTSAAKPTSLLLKFEGGRASN
jgi:hypothetical protein